MDVNIAADGLIAQLKSHQNTYFDRDVAKALAVFNAAKEGALEQDKATEIYSLLKNAQHIAPATQKSSVLSHLYAGANNLASRITSIFHRIFFKTDWSSCQALLPAAMSKCHDKVSPVFAFDCAAIDIAKDAIKDAISKYPEHKDRLEGFYTGIQRSTNTSNNQAVTFDWLKGLFGFLQDLEDSKPVVKTVPERPADVPVYTFETPIDPIDAAEEELGIGLAQSSLPDLEVEEKPSIPTFSIEQRVSKALAEHLTISQAKTLQEKIPSLNIGAFDVNVSNEVKITLNPHTFKGNFAETVQSVLQDNNLLKDVQPENQFKPGYTDVAKEFADQQHIQKHTKEITNLLRHSPEYSLYLLTQAESWMSLSKEQRKECADNLLKQSVTTLYGIDKDRLKSVFRSLGMQEPVFLKNVSNELPTIKFFDRKDKPSKEYPYPYVLTIRKGPRVQPRNICLGFFKEKEIPKELKQVIDQIQEKWGIRTTDNGQLHVSDLTKVDNPKETLSLYKPLDINQRDQMYKAIKLDETKWGELPGVMIE